MTAGGATRVWLALAGLGLLALPLLIGEYAQTLAIEVLIFGLFALGLNLLVGHTGYISLGQAMFLGFGGYGLGVLTLLFGLPTWPAAAITLAIIGLLGIALGTISMRVDRIQFLVVTLALAQLFYGVAVKTRVTGGDDGMAGVPRPDFAFLGLDSQVPAVFYYYVLAIFLAVLGLAYLFVRSPFGSVLVGIRENEKRMVALGYNISIYKNIAFAVSGLVSGLAGILLAQYQSFVSPDVMTWKLSGEGLLMVIIGGRQYFLGPVLGAAVFVLLKAELSAITDEYMIFFGLAFIVVVALFERGVAGFGLDLRRRLSRRTPAGE